MAVPPHLELSRRAESLRERDPPPQPPAHESKEPEESMPATSDFVKKLYKMLEDTSFQHVVSWGPHGDCFVVKDMNEFTKSILPRMFKHSNFASFVRQLNKYDFHKVKNTDDNTFGEHSWTFRHPDFHADRRDALENIKRKVPAARKSLPARGANGGSPSPSTSGTIDALQAQIERLCQTQDDMAAHIRNLENNYQNVLTEMVNFQRNMAQQDGLMQNLISYFLQMENGKMKEDVSAPLAPDPNPFLPTQEAQRMMGSYPETDVARASLFQMNEISRRAEVAGMSFGANEPADASGSGAAQSATTSAGQSQSQSDRRSASPRPTRPPSSASRIMAAAAGLMAPGPGGDLDRPLSRQDTLARIEELQRTRAQTADSAPSAPAPSAGPSAPGGQAASSSSSSSAADAPYAPPPGEGGGEPFLMPPSPPPGVGGDMQQYPLGSMTHEGLQVFTLGHLMPRSSVEDENGNWSFDPLALGALMPLPEPGAEGLLGEGEVGAAAAAFQQQQQQQPSAGPSTFSAGAAGPSGGAGASTSSAGGATGMSPQTLRVRRSTFVPGWAVPPRVLLVEDDAVSRKLSSKFLQVFGCTIDVAVDGVGAVNKMNLEKYDLVLMDIVMPKLDGVSATSLIRQFDHMTPIISMTSNSKPNEIMTYYHSGMNDILPKPFTKEGLLEMLEKHLMHLKVIQQMSKFPRSVGIPPLSDANVDQALSGAVQPSGPLMAPPDDDGRINPLAGMGLSDEQYAMILQGLVSGADTGMGMMSMSMGSGKRGLEEEGDGRDGKRGRFEVLE
ncbi:hypothetical protein DENSPDRAFT_862045 [Dentipellis sp. KUC8613]|nr:hypothetical protein DENSPDRAFT_862045 [Dentipellis sp. KUC8613]